MPVRPRGSRAPVRRESADERKVLAAVDEDLPRVAFLDKEFLPQMEARGYTRHELEEFFIWQSELRALTKEAESLGIEKVEVITVMPGRDIPTGERLTELECALEKYVSDLHLTEKERSRLTLLAGYYFNRRRELQRKGRI